VGEWICLLSPWLALIGLIIWDTRASKKGGQAPLAGTEKGSTEAGADDQFGSSPDFKALIHTIRGEGRAYRKEEQREDRGKRFREWITIILIALTLGAVSYQVYEMIKVYEPVKEQAEAAQIAADATKRAADAATRQSEIASRQADIATKQADNSDKAMMQAQRAWIGPRDARLESKPVAGQKNKFVVEYQNTGKEPALDFVFDAATLVSTDAEETDGRTGKKMTDYLLKCVNTPARALAGVVFPTSGFAASQLSVDINEKMIDDDVAAGTNKALIVQGCFAYQTGNIVRHSAFCFFYRANRSDSAHLNVCLSGNYAD
jgi:uncharacterized protein YecT (DUF1311 family)